MISSRVSHSTVRPGTSSLVARNTPSGSCLTLIVTYVVVIDLVSAHQSFICPDVALLCRPSDIYDQAQAEHGERRLHVFHSRSVTRVEHAVDLRQVPA
jgi:hypothetical protein